MIQQLPLISFVTFLPLAAALVLACVRGDRLAYSVSLLATLFTFALSLFLWLGFSPNTGGYQYQELAEWIPDFGISYLVGIDGISIFLVLLTTLLMPIIVVASRLITKALRGYLICMLVLETAMIGTLVARDIFLFYLFWELMLAPMYFIIGIWGGKRRIYATLKFVLYTVVGSLLMLVALIYVVWRHADQFGVVSFALHDLLRTGFTLEEEIWLFLACALAFGIKVPIFPFHTWLPDAHVEAPTGGSVVLAGVLLKMGLYGFIRFAYPLFPRGGEIFMPLLGLLAVVGVVYGALVAWAQSDMKKLVAYSSVSHLGYCVLGFAALSSISLTGSIYQMLNHGISTGALFLLVGVLYDRRHTREISEYGGLAAKIPIFAALFLVFTLSSVALPLTNGFVGEFLILVGSFEKFPGLTIVALSGVVLGAIYMLTLYLRTMFGEIDTAKNGDLKDVTPRELLTFAPLLVLVFVMGVFPQPFLRVIEPTVNSYLLEIEQRRTALNEFENQGGGSKGERSGRLQLAKSENFYTTNGAVR